MPDATMPLPATQAEIVARFERLNVARDHALEDGRQAIRLAANAIRVTRRIVSQPALAKYQPEEFKPGVEYQTEEALMKAAGDIGTTIFHPVGTARMGAASDPLAVLDGRLRVRGVEGLRVIDASVMPTITSGNTNSPTLMIAERGAEMIIEDARSVSRGTSRAASEVVAG